MKKGVQFAALSALLIFGSAYGVVALRPDVAREIWSSAVIAFVVQVIGFALARPLMAKNPIGGWGIGSAIRFSVVLLHAFVGIPFLGLALSPALLSLVSFLFVTMLVEPLFLT